MSVAAGRGSCGSAAEATRDPTMVQRKTASTAVRRVVKRKDAPCRAIERDAGGRLYSFSLLMSAQSRYREVIEVRQSGVQKGRRTRRCPTGSLHRATPAR